MKGFGEHDEGDGANGDQRTAMAVLLACSMIPIASTADIARACTCCQLHPPGWAIGEGGKHPARPLPLIRFQASPAGATAFSLEFLDSGKESQPWQCPVEAKATARPMQRAPANSLKTLYSVFCAELMVGKWPHEACDELV